MHLCRQGTDYAPLGSLSLFDFNMISIVFFFFYNSGLPGNLCKLQSGWHTLSVLPLLPGAPSLTRDPQTLLGSDRPWD